MSKTRVAAVLAAHNRRDLPLACLGSLRAQRVPGVTLDAFVLDDASSDGTPEAITQAFPEVTVLHGDGQLYWSGGMRRAFAAAIAGRYGYYLWMNDDTCLNEGALAVLLETEQRLCEQDNKPIIVVGSTRHPETGELTYGGRVRPSRARPLHFKLVEPGIQPRPCDTMNGNAVLISHAVVQRVGNIDPAFKQKMGDYDYGLRARSAGCSIWVAPGTIGTCAGHPAPSAIEQQSLLEELRRLWSIKELPPGSWAVFARRWAGRLWPLRWLSPYVRRGGLLVLKQLAPRRNLGCGAT
jgi:GT2 family glycosyltransferase